MFDKAEPILTSEEIRDQFRKVFGREMTKAEEEALIVYESASVPSSMKTSPKT